LKQYTGWLKVEPPVIWLSGLHNPESYLTALVQKCCRTKKWALDKSTLFTSVTKIEDYKTVRERPEFGCYVTGLYLEGVSWDVQKQCIRDQNPKELIMRMPVV
jgi:dynein heavy chain, axonemal